MMSVFFPWDWKSIFIKSELDRLKAVIGEKRLELANGKGVVFHRGKIKIQIYFKT